MNAPAASSQPNAAFALGALASLVALIALSLLWELWLAPLRPGAWALALKALPLAFALPGVARRSVYTLQWASMLVLLYLAEGVVRGMTDARPSASLGWLAALLALAFFGFALAYVAPFKRAARLDTRAKKS
ncbi:Probable transmembrane protein [Candidatus Paraburkholderia kirkii UZHbot1]|uniref:Probable transmembrane protein n=1 Tax=Candidatus Paraburkholderia kirkii UZHbot1 TaxID=1055526 RepID=G4M637_9BURK|nr:Probable transmembrane protein [Candidatus Paraburkholderia kirkii UZHbot1]